MTDYRKVIEEHSCKTNQGCGAATTCVCVLAEDMADEIERLRDALLPLATQFLWPIDLGLEMAEDIKTDEDWSEEANDETITEIWVKRGDIRKARATLGEDKK